MKKIMQSIKKHFLKKQDYINLFIKHNVRIEGWFQGELIKLFSSKQIRREYNLEIVKIGKKKEGRKPDFVIKINGNEKIIELKAISVDRRTLGFYFKTKKGLIKEFEKLNKSNAEEYLLIFAYPIDFNEWQEKVKKTENKYNIQEISNKVIDKLLISLWSK